MRQIDKLHGFIKNPLRYGIRKNSRVYKAICRLAVFGIATTGYSDKNTKHVETFDVINVLYRLKVACGNMNVSPRGGACGERVFLKGKVKSDCVKNYKKFVDAFLLEHPKKKSLEAKNEFIASLQK
jgi:hypothetical protein